MLIASTGDGTRASSLNLMVASLAILFAVYWTIGQPAIMTQDEQPASLSLKKLLIASVEMAKLGGREVWKVRQKTDIGERSKSDTVPDPVTEGDTRSHLVMYYGLKKSFPGLSVISEEDNPSTVDLSQIESATFKDPDVSFDDPEDFLVNPNDVDVWIDPLDATQEFTENLVEYVTTMVCVAVKGVPVIGVIHKPFTNMTVWGWAGPNLRSASLPAETSTSGSNDLSQSRLIVSRSHAGAVHEVAKKAFGPEVRVTPAGGAGFKAWEVALGKQDAYVHTTLIKKWDICPGDALLSALGGKMTTLTGEEIDYSRNTDVKNVGGVLATLSNHQLFVALLKDTLVTTR